jgi:TolA-binding protein
VLADLYNSQGKREEAAAMASKAAALGAAGGGGSAQDSYNQGVILWNAGKIAEAKTQFEAAVKADPNYADANYWVGMANLNGGNMSEAVKYFENYLKLAPTGPMAAQAKGIVDQIKPKE